MVEPPENTSTARRLMRRRQYPSWLLDSFPSLLGFILGKGHGQVERERPSYPSYRPLPHSYAFFLPTTSIPMQPLRPQHQYPQHGAHRPDQANWLEPVLIHHAANLVRNRRLHKPIDTRKHRDRKARPRGAINI